MTLAPRAPKQDKRRLSTYDLEWYPGSLKFRMCGVYDEDKGYRCYSSMGSFLQEELIPDNYGRTFYAHNGGKSDMHFVMNELIGTGLAKSRFLIEAVFNGSSAFLVTLRERNNPKNKFIFADTLFLLKSSLKKIGQWLGYEKMDIDDFATENWHQLRVYNERDCEVLFKAVTQLEAELHQMGGEFKTTLASSAMALFQTHYLHEVLPTDYATNVYARRAYYASRVEVFTRECTRALYMDVNSSFPHSMRKVLPGRFIRTTKTMRERPRSAVRYIAEATVRVKECYLPPLPYRDKRERILFPTGEWKGVFADTDLELLEEEGHQILEVHSVDWFEGFSALKDYVDDLYEKKSNSEGFKREVYKLLLNSLYGKFAEGETKRKLLIEPESVECPHKMKHPGNSCMEMIRPGFWTREDFKPLQHVHVPLSMAITAESRRLLFNYMRVPLQRGGKLNYSDTDSIVYSAPCNHSPAHGSELVPPMEWKAGVPCPKKERVPAWQNCMSEGMDVGEEVGKLKLEYRIDDGGHFAAAKLYMIENHGKILVKSKGFSRLDGASYMQLCAGESLTLRRMSGMKENIRSGDMTPREIMVPKVARFLRTKRADIGKTGETRPWTVEEIEADESGLKR